MDFGLQSFLPLYLTKGDMLNCTTKNFGKVYIVDDEPLDIMGKDDIQVKISNQSMRKLKNVRHVLGLKSNLIFIE